MIPRECKRLAEVDFPIAEVSKHAVREKCTDSTRTSLNPASVKKSFSHGGHGGPWLPVEHC